MPAEDHPALKLFRRLLDAPAPSGREERIGDVIRSILDEMGYAHETDGAGNVSVRLEGREPEARLCVLAAHMDEIAMVVTAVHEDGSLSVDRSGGLYPCKIGEGPVEVLGDRGCVTAVLSMGSMHRPDAATRSITWADVRLLTGLSPEQLARSRGARRARRPCPRASGAGRSSSAIRPTRWSPRGPSTTAWAAWRCCGCWRR